MTTTASRTRLVTTGVVACALAASGCSAAHRAARHPVPVTHPLHTAQFAARLLACTGPKPFDMAEFATRLGGIAAETHRKLGEVVRSHADDVTTSWVEGRARAGEERRKLASGGRSGERRQMVA